MAREPRGLTATMSLRSNRCPFKLFAPHRFQACATCVTVAGFNEVIVARVVHDLTGQVLRADPRGVGEDP